MESLRVSLTHPEPTHITLSVQAAGTELIFLQAAALLPQNDSYQSTCIRIGHNFIKVMLGSSTLG